MRIICVCSAKGGVGKTTVAANLGSALSKMGKRVLIFDGNYGTANLGLHFGLNYVPLTYVDAMRHDDLEIKKSIYIHPSGIRIAPAPLEAPAKINAAKMKSFLDSFKSAYDIVIVDSAPGLGKEALDAIEISDEIIIVTTPDLPSVISSNKTIEFARKVGKDILGIVVNRVEKSSFEMSKDEVESMCKEKVIAIIPDSKDVQKCITLQVPLVLQEPRDRVSKAFFKLAGKVLGYEEEAGILNELRKFLSSIFIKKPKLEKGKDLVEETIEEMADVEELREELKEELKKDVRKVLKKSIMRKLKRKLREEGFE